ncbi:hypothetical protein [Acetobacter malorum]|uniref:hypothetical protein n=1 Tax=Acetobacter malorum TaxID=178901 RepID=UPI000A3AE4B3|nr:hypothetical protein [Acetobacter malorum]
MKYQVLHETAAGSGQYNIVGAAIEAESTSAALALVGASVPPGLRYAVSPYREVAGLPDYRPPAAEEVGKSYAVLLRTSLDQPFAPDGASFASMVTDAANMCLAMQAYMPNAQFGLMPANEQPVSAPVEPIVPSTSAASSSSAVSIGNLPGSSGISSGGTVSGSSTVSSGGTAS